MKVSFAHANPPSNESTLLRFDDPAFDRTPCVLIDAGRGVDVEALLGEDDRLVGSLLTHAHQDHYLTLGHNLPDSATVYAAPGTAAILDIVLADGSQYDQLGDTEAVIDRLESVDTWVDIHDVLRIHPVPAGHAPGASGFALQFLDDTQWRTILITGDFTLTRSGGYPQFSTDLLLDVEAMVLTGATAAQDDREDMLQTTVQRAIAGSSVLLTATGLSCVEYAYLLGHLCNRVYPSVEITLVGQAAKLYERLEYDVPNVRAVPTFETTYDVMERGSITIAGPQVPTEGASGRLFGSIRESGEATLVQVTDGATRPIDSSACTRYAFSHIAHPTESEIDALVEAYTPAAIFVTHQHGQGLTRYRDRHDSFVWAVTDDKFHTLFDECWTAPPWMSGRRLTHAMSNCRATSQQLVGDPPMPSLSRAESIDFAAEGLNIESPERFKQLMVTQ